ncbi:hypothetical protein GAYE_SCF67G6894 [Galdieria yellowstonensis]|uniref:AN1-type domain-containing protein n=1 Tax=Galdieria yellowstonensis TaxID=3028027 RepID=A0AAV9INE9_9RHOD|nr:hypothetical protein GAYE_SCF67G6894 [Galdieria yellowstonensis]
MADQSKPVELIGENCSFKGCNQLDFLPYTCEYCGRTFCGKHRLPPSHHCQDYKNVPTNQTIPTKPQQQLETCSQPKCNKITVTRCGECAQSFCASHRNTDQHDCINKKKKNNHVHEKTKTSSSPNFLEKLANKFHKSRKNAESSKTARTVFHMKQKSKAVGNPEIPMQDRVYLYVTIDDHVAANLATTRSLQQPLSLYYPKYMTIGQVLDKVCEKKGIINRNHQNNTTGKLCFVDGETHKPVDPATLLSQCNQSSSGMLSLILTQLDEEKLRQK